MPAPCHFSTGADWTVVTGQEKIVVGEDRVYPVGDEWLASLGSAVGAAIQPASERGHLARTVPQPVGIVELGRVSSDADERADRDAVRQLPVGRVLLGDLVSEP